MGYYIDSPRTKRGSYLATLLQLLLLNYYSSFSSHQARKLFSDDAIKRLVYLNAPHSPRTKRGSYLATKLSVKEWISCNLFEFSSHQARKLFSDFVDLQVMLFTLFVFDSPRTKRGSYLAT